MKQQDVTVSDYFLGAYNKPQTKTPFIYWILPVKSNK